MNKYIFFVVFLVFSYSCKQESNTNTTKVEKAMIEEVKEGTYGYDKTFLNKHVKTIELKNENAAVLVIPQYQGRVMTSTCCGENGSSYGWINYHLIKSGKTLEHMNGYGGEERFWLGPEGGQFSIFFKKGTEFDFENWFTPKEIDTEAFDLISSNASEVVLGRTMLLENYSGRLFNLEVERKINILSSSEIEKELGISLNSAKAVAYKSANKLTNIGESQWTEQSGMLSVWLLAMLNPSAKATIVIPVKQGDEKSLGKTVNDDYFGKIPASRLKISSNTVFFKGDGQSRGKIGISPQRAKPFLGSYDAENKILTIVKVKLPENTTRYVNSAWELQDEPFLGDALNAYNDGPLEDGSQMGPFYEIESSSPALGLKPKESYTHIQTTYHFEGKEKDLNSISEKILGVSIKTIKSQF